MGDLVLHRLQFAFTIVYHYLFPQLTMGLALLIVLMKVLGLRPDGELWNDAARFWIRIFGINFAVGVVTGIPMEFQFGTNWARFSRYAGSVIGQTLAMEGLFAFFLESSFLFVLVWGERRLSRRGHFFAAVALFLGSWLSGYFIIATNAFMQHPVGHGVAADGTLRLVDFGAFVLNRWAIVAVRAQHDGRRGHRRLRHGRGRRVLHAAPDGTSRPRGSFCGSGWARASSRVCSSPSPATGRPRWWPVISRWRWPPWRAVSRAVRAPGSC